MTDKKSAEAPAKNADDPSLPLQSLLVFSSPPGGQIDSKGALAASVPVAVSASPAVLTLGTSLIVNGSLAVNTPITDSAGGAVALPTTPYNASPSDLLTGNTFVNALGVPATITLPNVSDIVTYLTGLGLPPVTSGPLTTRFFFYVYPQTFAVTIDATTNIGWQVCSTTGTPPTFSTAKQIQVLFSGPTSAFLYV